MCCGHREYALPAGRKRDPHTIDMDAFRGKVAAVMAGTAVIKPLIAAVDSKQRSTLRRGSRGDLVKIVQRAVGVKDDGIFGPGTDAAVRQYQRDHDLVPDGIVGPASWRVIDKS
jgi:peptidoglycan hydrolase-like protein with peptidoglycan-binding domain